jgi:hypothetical protein
MKDRKYENPFFHMFTLYGLPPSKLPKAAFEAAVGKDTPVAGLSQPSATTTSSRFPATSFVKPLTDSSISYPRITPSTTPQFRWLVTSHELQTAISLAERVSRGEVAGTSGLVRSNPVVTDLLRFVENLKQQGTLPSSQNRLLSDARKIRFVETGDLSTSVAARQTVLDNVTSRLSNNDSVPSKPKVVEVSDTSESETEQTEDPDDVIFDNQEHILDRPIADSELCQAIEPYIPVPGSHNRRNNGSQDDEN